MNFIILFLRTYSFLGRGIFMSKKKKLIVQCYYKEKGPTIEELIRKSFVLYFQEEFDKIKEQYG